MKIFADVKPKSKKQSIEKIDAAHFRISVKEPACEGKANHAVAKALAKHFDVPLSNVELRSGATAKHKLFDIWGV